MSSAVFYSAAAVGYFVALLAYISHMVSDGARVKKAATVTASLAFLAQTVGLALRWYEAGIHEIAAAEEAEGVVLAGLQRFVTLSSHPPWSNLYEIMVFMSWGIVLVFLITEVKWQLRGMGVPTIGMALLTLGIASLTLDATVRPLVPVLRSYWLHLHVFSASIGYAAGLLAAIASLLYLSASQAHRHKVGFGAQFTTAVLLLLVGRGWTLLATFDYSAKVFTSMQGELLQLTVPTQQGTSAPVYSAMPFVGALMMLCLVLALLSMYFHWRHFEQREKTGAVRLLAVLSAVSLTLLMVVIVGQDLARVAAPLSPSVAQMVHGEAFFTLKSNQWDLGLLVLAWMGNCYSLLMLLVEEPLRRRLPQPAKLDRLAYRSVLVAFTFVGLLIVTGAIWAHYAWGRYWGWDPKETGSLVIWFVYAAYLHTRFTHGLSGKPSAVIAIFGFFVVLAGFLGVNLGWFSSGLHSYGS